MLHAVHLLSVTDPFKIWRKLRGSGRWLQRYATEERAPRDFERLFGNSVHLLSRTELNKPNADTFPP